MRRPVRLVAALAVLMVAGVAIQQNTVPAEPATASPVAVKGDAGDDVAPTTFDGPMVRKRAAIAIRPAKGADRDHIRAELADRVKKHPRVHGPLTEATFAVFSESMLNYLVPEMTFVLPEDVRATDAEAFMRDEQPDDVAFYLVEPVLVHSLTFAVIPSAATPEAVLDRANSEGILTDVLGEYDASAEPAGVMVRYFGAVLSDASIDSVKQALSRAAGVSPDRVWVEPTEATGGVDLSNGVPDLGDAPHGHHS
jgi:hypothetical protein